MRSTPVAVAAALILGLSGCAGSASDLPGFSSRYAQSVTEPAVPPSSTPVASVSPTTPGDTATPTPAPTPTQTAIACEGTDITVSESTTVTGHCGTLTVTGQRVVVHASDVDHIVIRGIGDTVFAGTVTSLQISGQQSQVGASSIETVAISGDSNTVQSDGSVGSATVSGDTNTVTGSTVGSITDNGSDNQLG